MAGLLGRLTRLVRPRPEARSTSPISPAAQTFAYLTGPRSTLDQRVAVGQLVDSARLLHLEPSERSAHLYCAGITGSGKTRWLQHLICSDLAVGQPFVVLDPFGGLFRAVRELIATGLEQAMSSGFEGGGSLLNRYRFLDLSDPENPLQINPLAPHPLETVEQQVDDLMRALERLLGNSLEEQRKLRNVLRGTFALTAEFNRLPASTLPPFLHPHLPLTPSFSAEILNMTAEQRQLLLNLIPPERQSQYQRQYWRFVGGLSNYERNQLVQSSWNVYQYLLSDELVSRFLTATTTLDLPRLLRDGTSLICYLPSGANLTGARLVGKYLTTKLQHSAYRCPPAERKQRLRLYLDEFHHWTDQAFADALTNLRQFGIDVTCAHQSQSQPPFDTTEGRALLRTIQANSRLKALFRLARPDAENLATELFELSQEKPNYETVDHTHGTSEQQSTSRGSSTASGYGTRSGDGRSQSQNLESSALTVGNSNTQTRSTEHSTQTEHSESSSTGRSESSTRRTVYFTLEGERETLVNSLQRLPQRQFYFAVEPLRGHLLEAPFVPDELYHYAASDLPAELMTWQRQELSTVSSLPAETPASALNAAATTTALPSPAPTWNLTMPTAAPQPAESADILDVDITAIEATEPDDDDPFLD